MVHGLVQRQQLPISVSLEARECYWNITILSGTQGITRITSCLKRMPSWTAEVHGNRYRAFEQYFENNLQPLVTFTILCEMLGMLVGYREENREQRWISKQIVLTQRNTTPSIFRNSCKNCSIQLPW